MCLVVVHGEDRTEISGTRLSFMDLVDEIQIRNVVGVVTIKVFR